MRYTAICSWLLLATVAAAQVPMPGQPAEPLQFLSADDVRSQIDAAKGLPGAELPDAEARRAIVARVNGEAVTLDEVLDEVLHRFAGPLVPGLLNQAVMRMETIKRGTGITDEEFVEGVQVFLAQKKSIEEKKTLREILSESQLSWDTFERMISDQVKIHKVVRGDLNIPHRKEALNPFLLQIWAGQKLQGQYTMNMDEAKLPPGVLGEVATTVAASKALARLAAGGARLESPAAAGSEKLVVIPGDGGWPRYRIPNVPIDEMKDDGEIAKTPAAVMIEMLLDPERAAPEKAVEAYLRIHPGENEPALEVPSIQVTKQDTEKGPAASAPLAEALEAVGKQGFRLQPDGKLRSAEGAWPAYTLPDAGPGDPARARLVEIVNRLAGKPVTIETRVRVARRFDLPEVPIAMFSRIDRDYVLLFSYGKLEDVHYEEALKSLARFRAARQAFRARDIRVDEKAVQAVIDAENAKYNHPLFNRKMILQAQGKSEFDENRRLWLANGVDQIIGTEKDENKLRAYYEANILHFGQATVDASHILVEAKEDPKTGKLDYDAARERIDKIAAELFANPRPAAVFGELARRYSDDKMTADKGGNLGPFPLRGQMDREFARAAFALRPGEISAPVKTAYGWHLILCQKSEGPDREKFSFEDPETRARVEGEYQQERRDAWLEANAYAGMKLEKLSKVFSGGK
jgi:parvulin-like peptidyl-prolyl isomerase